MRLSDRVLILFRGNAQLIIKCVSFDVCQLRECVLARPSLP